MTNIIKEAINLRVKENKRVLGKGSWEVLEGRKEGVGDTFIFQLKTLK